MAGTEWILFLFLPHLVLLSKRLLREDLRLPALTCMWFRINVGCFYSSGGGKAAGGALLSFLALLPGNLSVICCFEMNHLQKQWLKTTMIILLLALVVL